MLNTQRGFTLVEVMVAVSITGIALVGLMSLFLHSRHFVTDSNHTLQAVHLAQGVLEELKARDYDDVVERPKTPFSEAPGYSYAVSVSPSSFGYDLKTVTVTVYYQERGQEKKLSLSMEKGKR